MKARKTVAYLLILAAAPGALVLCLVFLPGKTFVPAATAICLLALAGFFLSYEKGKNNGASVVLTAVFTALSVLSRLVFAALPAFKPVTCMVMFAGMYLGGEPGFLVGALSALISNFTFGQGAWTPVQMIAWGVVGALSGLLGGLLRKKRWVLCSFGALFGVLFSAVMDLWTVVWMNGGFTLPYYLTVLVSSLPFTVTYAVSDIVFLLLLAEPMRRTMDRVNTKFGVGILPEE